MQFWHVWMGEHERSVCRGGGNEERGAVESRNALCKTFRRHSSDSTHRLILLARDVRNPVLLKILVDADIVTTIAGPCRLLGAVEDDLDSGLDVVEGSLAQDLDAIGKL